jgi:hypothetical protein
VEEATIDAADSGSFTEYHWRCSNDTTRVNIKFATTAGPGVSTYDQTSSSCRVMHRKRKCMH